MNLKACRRGWKGFAADGLNVRRNYRAPHPFMAGMGMRGLSMPELTKGVLFFFVEKQFVYLFRRRARFDEVARVAVGLSADFQL